MPSNFILSTAGEVHLQRCMDDLTKMYKLFYIQKKQKLIFNISIDMLVLKSMFQHQLFHFAKQYSSTES